MPTVASATRAAKASQTSPSNGRCIANIRRAIRQLRVPGTALILCPVIAACPPVADIRAVDGLDDLRGQYGTDELAGPHGQLTNISAGRGEDLIDIVRAHLTTVCPPALGDVVPRRGQQRDAVEDAAEAELQPLFSDQPAADAAAAIRAG